MGMYSHIYTNEDVYIIEGLFLCMLDRLLLSIPKSTDRLSTPITVSIGFHALQQVKQNVHGPSCLLTNDCEEKQA